MTSILHEVYSLNLMYEQHRTATEIVRKMMLYLQYYLEERVLNHENDLRIVFDLLECEGKRLIKVRCQYVNLPRVFRAIDGLEGTDFCSLAVCDRTYLFWRELADGGRRELSSCVVLADVDDVSGMLKTETIEELFFNLISSVLRGIFWNRTKMCRNTCSSFCFFRRKNFFINCCIRCNIFVIIIFCKKWIHLSCICICLTRSRKCRIII